MTTNRREAFEEAAASDDPRLQGAARGAHEDLKKSVTAHSGHMPAFDDAYESLKTLVTNGELNIQCVNSDVQLEPILDPETAELKLRTQANLFIGSIILDRGITIENLIAFYYGRKSETDACRAIRGGSGRPARRVRSRQGQREMPKNQIRRIESPTHKPFAAPPRLEAPLCAG